MFGHICFSGEIVFKAGLDLLFGDPHILLHLLRPLGSFHPTILLQRSYLATISDITRQHRFHTDISFD